MHVDPIDAAPTASSRRAHEACAGSSRDRLVNWTTTSSRRSRRRLAGRMLTRRPTSASSSHRPEVRGDAAERSDVTISGPIGSACYLSGRKVTPRSAEDRPTSSPKMAILRPVAAIGLASTRSARRRDRVRWSRRDRGAQRPRRRSREARSAGGRVRAWPSPKVCGIETEYGIIVRGAESQPGRGLVAADQRLRRRAPAATRRIGWDFEDEQPGNDARGFASTTSWPPRSRPTWSTPCSPTAPATTSTTPTRSSRTPECPDRARGRALRPGRRGDPAARRWPRPAACCPPAPRSSSTRTTPTARATATAATRTT